ncbi:EAL domain-containing protein [Bacillus sp. BGMRC 2118]|nr:EAL domain-containing protein [Bacillus sp. BGMRC 2118]
MIGAGFFNIENIIKEGSFFNEYQPLWNTKTEEIFAYEALIRTEPRVNPIELFQYGRENGLLYDFDTLAILNAIKEYPNEFFQKYLLFINIFPSTLKHPEFTGFIRKLISDHPEIRGKIVFEINEDPAEATLWKEEEFERGLLFLKKMGFLIALDDLRINPMILEKILANKPDFLKLDRKCSQNLSHSRDKQENIEWLVAYSHNKLVLVLEGIENKDDLVIAKQLGVPLLQGYYIEKPHRLL